MITSSEQSYFWPLTSHKLGTEIDSLAKEADVTVFAGGVQDVSLGVLPYALTSTCHHVDSISGTSLAIIDEFGPDVMEEAMIGMSKEEFIQAAIGQNDAPLDSFTISVYALANKLGLHPTKKEVIFKPIPAKKTIFCKALNREIPVGNLLGNIITTQITTEEGIKLSCSFISKLYEEGDSAYNRWEIKGLPDMDIMTTDMHGELTATSGMINPYSRRNQRSLRISYRQ